jgi:hypothetical protein
MFKDQEETEARYDELGRSPSGCLSYSSLVIAAVGGYKSGVEDKNGRAQHVIKWMKRRHDMGVISHIEGAERDASTQIVRFELGKENWIGKWSAGGLYTNTGQDSDVSYNN